MKKSVGIPFDQEFLRRSLEWLSEEFALSSSVPGGMARYRLSLMLSFFFKFFQHLKGEEASVSRYERGISKGHQDFEISSSAVGSSQLHNSSLKQTTGEAQYVDDIPKFENEKFAALVLSDRAHAEIRYKFLLGK